MSQPSAFIAQVGASDPAAEAAAASAVSPAVGVALDGMGGELEVPAPTAEFGKGCRTRGRKRPNVV